MHVLDSETEEVSKVEFEKIQHARSYLIWHSKKLNWDFFRIVITNKGDLGQIIEIMNGHKV